MRRILLVLGVVLGVAFVALSVATDRLARPKLEGTLEGDPVAAVTIAPPSVALTFARRAGPSPAVLLVTDAGPDGLRAVDLSRALGGDFTDAIGALDALGFDALEQAAREAETIEVAYDELGLPFDAATPHVAAGTNFRAHAEEVGLDEGPFLFPKLSRATAWSADVPDRGRLDYEVEICAVTLGASSREAPAPLGFVLCNDFTDRWMLLREIDLGQPMGVTGFPDAKGGERMLPVGPLLVVPREAERFHERIEMELYVNGALRQQALGGLMIWTPSEIVEQALAQCEVDYATANGSVRLTPCDAIPARTLILTGTPAGVMFHPVTVWSASAYLQPGDEVVAVATHLGVLRNVVR